MIRVLVSSCLLGELVRYNGGHKRAESDVLHDWQKEGRLVLFCPEVFGGLSVPRLPAEIQNGDGDGVLDGRAPVHDRDGGDVTEAFVSGARGAVTTASQYGVKLAILKENSPSCGSSFIHDGSFSGAKLAGRGVAAAALARAGVRVFSEDEIPAAKAFLEELESSARDEDP